MANDMAICITKFDHICQTCFTMRPKKCSMCAKIKKTKPLSGCNIYLSFLWIKTDSSLIVSQRVANCPKWN